jgi:hypothetical protein
LIRIPCRILNRVGEHFDLRGELLSLSRVGQHEFHVIQNLGKFRGECSRLGWAGRGTEHKHEQQQD